MSILGRNPHSQPDGQAGFAIVEVLVAAVFVIGIAGALFGLLNASARSSAEERHRSQAYALAQEDQARMRALRIPVLNNLNQNRAVNLNATPYTVNSRAFYVNDSTGTTSCGVTSSSADYVRITSTVTWPSIGSRPPAVIQSIVAPPVGSRDPFSGTLTVTAMNAAGGPLSGIGLSGTGAGTFSGSTDTGGCAMFPDIAAGNYTMTTSAPGKVDNNGNPPGPRTVSVVAGATNTVSLQYDTPGSINVTFRSRVGSTATMANNPIDSMIAFNTGMTTAKLFGIPGGARLSPRVGTPLFPFTSPISVYGGACTGSLPSGAGSGAAVPSVPVTPGGTSNVIVQLPALNLTVRNGTSSSPGSVVNNARVVTYDLQCQINNNPIEREFRTNSSGQLNSSPNSDRGLPWGSYGVCVDTSPITSSPRLTYTLSTDVKNLTSGTTLNLYMNQSGTSMSGTCS